MGPAAPTFLIGSTVRHQDTHLPCAAPRRYTRSLDDGEDVCWQRKVGTRGLSCDEKGGPAAADESKKIHPSKRCDIIEMLL